MSAEETKTSRASTHSFSSKKIAVVQPKPILRDGFSYDSKLFNLTTRYRSASQADSAAAPVAEWSRVRRQLVADWTALQTTKKTDQHISWIGSAFVVVFAVAIAVLYFNLAHLALQATQETIRRHSWTEKQQREECRKTCKLEIVESIPENVTFDHGPIPRSTYDAWKTIIRTARVDIDIAAYKSSLRGKHVLPQPMLPSQATRPGERIFEELVRAGLDRGVAIRLVENHPPRDKGDNADGTSLEKRGAAHRRPLDYTRVFGTGTMHSKFILADQRHVYLGSANLDWRSLNQKLELGVLLTDCPCIGEDLRKLFDLYWAIGSQTQTMSSDDLDKLMVSQRTPYNMETPLRVNADGIPTDIYLAASPKTLNSADRTWDLDAILSVINSASKYLYIHVMDYIPMMVYTEPERYWPVIDDALRRAALERHVRVRLLVAALHFQPRALYFLESLQSFSAAASAGLDEELIQVRIFKVPVVTEFHNVIARERRTHNKFLASESTVIIGTSNWSGDYFSGTSGAAIVVNQTATTRRPIVEQMRSIFDRDWLSTYAHTLSEYMSTCWGVDADRSNPMCETEKSEEVLAKSLPF